MALIEVEGGKVWQEKSRLLSVRVPESMALALEKCSQDRLITVSELVRYALYLYLAPEVALQEIVKVKANPNYLERLSNLEKVLSEGIKGAQETLSYLRGQRSELLQLEGVLRKAQEKQSIGAET